MPAAGRPVRSSSASAMSSASRLCFSAQLCISALEPSAEIACRAIAAPGAQNDAAVGARTGGGAKIRIDADPECIDALEQFGRHAADGGFRLRPDAFHLRVEQRILFAAIFATSLGAGNIARAGGQLEDDGGVSPHRGKLDNLPPAGDRVGRATGKQCQNDDGGG